MDSNFKTIHCTTLSLCVGCQYNYMFFIYFKPDNSLRISQSVTTIADLGKVGFNGTVFKMV